jgi:acyl-lipid omega-6 desaturase (Delta-12 desaturase)
MPIPPPGPAGSLPKMAELNGLLAPYQKSSTRHSILQLVTTLVPYVFLWVLMAFSLRVSYALTLALAVVAAAFLVRIFIFFHDCGHNSFFPSVKANKTVGFWLGVLLFTPGEQWWHSHAIHHATSGNLDKRGTGDVTTLTTDEYYQSRWFGRLGYRFFRNPLVMFGLGPFFSFLIMNRLATPKYGQRETRSVVLANLAILGLATTISLVIGVKGYLMIQVPVMMMAGAAGIWLFYVQHQFENPYWEHTEKWDYVASALLGASYLKLPGLLNWISGSIGYHHIHHLSPRIPNYNLARAHENTPLIQKWTRVISLQDGLRYTRLKLWDEPLHRLVGFGESQFARMKVKKTRVVYSFRPTRQSARRR